MDKYYSRGLERCWVARDVDASPVDGKHLQYASRGLWHDVATNGELAVYNADEDLVCTYQPGAWHVLEDENGVRKPDWQSRSFAGPETPEKAGRASRPSRHRRCWRH